MTRPESQIISTNTFFKLKVLIILIQIILVYSCSKNSLLNTGLITKSTLYVNGATGNDANDGKTISSAFKTIQKAANNAGAGCLVLISGGTYKEQITIASSGTILNPIIFSGNNSDPVLIDGSGFNTGTMLSITDKSNLIFKGLTIKNFTGKDVQGILVNASANGGVANITFRHLTIQAISWSASTTTLPTSANNAQPFIVYGHGLTQANAVVNVILDSSVVSNNIPGFSEAISFDGNIDGFTISNNTVSNNTNIGIAAIGNYGTSTNSIFDQARNGLITGNTCFNNISLYATSAGIYIDGGRNIKITRNRTYSNGTGIEVGNEQNGNASNMIVAGNLLYQNQVAGLAIGGYDSKTTGQVLNSIFVNNTLYQNNTLLDGTGEMVVTKASGCLIENNIFCTNSQNLLYSLNPILPQSGNIINYNCWFTSGQNPSNIQVNYLSASYTAFGTYQQATSQDKQSLFSDPFFVNAALNVNFHLQASSMCLNAGNPAAIKDINASNFDGMPLISGGSVNIGAY